MQVRRFNLSRWALGNRPLMLFLVLGLALLGGWSYARLGQSEDPPFTYKVMIVQARWPGATAEQVSRQLTEPMEAALMNTGKFEFIQSSSRPGESEIVFAVRDDLGPAQVRGVMDRVRKRIGDMQGTLPQGVIGPFFNDEFGDTFGNIYALTAKGHDPAVMHDYAQRVQLALQRRPDVSKVELIGLQDEKIFIELSNTRINALQLSRRDVQQALADQATITFGSFYETGSSRVRLRASGQILAVEDIGNLRIRIGERTVRLSDVAEVHRGFADPAAPQMRVMGEDAIGVAVAMNEGSDIIALGAALDVEVARLNGTLPAGMRLTKVADQSQVVKQTVGDFVQVLGEAIVVVLLVSFFLLGLRAGLVVGVAIPLVMAMTFLVMYYLGIGLQRISLGALVLALGLLVDDAIIAVEIMATKMEQGMSRLAAACFTWQSTALPMLTGTLITVAGFLPIAMAASGVGEYTRSLFQVVAIALLASWVAAVLFVPYLGFGMLPDRAAGLGPGKRVDIYQKPVYLRFRALLYRCLQHRWWVLATMGLLFVAALMLFRFVPRQFFPNSTRPELVVDMTLGEGASLRATQALAVKLEALLAARKDIAQTVTYVGVGSPRFYMPLAQQPAATNFAQFVISAEDLQAREHLRRWLLEEVVNQLPEAHVRVSRLENGPPVGYPVQFRVSGEDLDQVQALARQVASKVRANPHITDVNLDWSAPSSVMQVQVDQGRARDLGVTSTDVSSFLAGALTGAPVGVYLKGNRQIEIVLRGTADERLDAGLLESLQMPTRNGGRISLAQVAQVSHGFEHGVIRHYNQLPTVTVRADISDGTQAIDVVEQIAPTLQAVRAQLPAGYLLEIGGTAESSEYALASIKAGIPLFVIVVMTLLMLQLRSFPCALMVLATAPLGIIGVVAFLFLFRTPFSFVAQLGTIALAGMIMRNSVILIDQIRQDIEAGNDRWNAILDATVRRARPIVLTSLTTVLAMIPLSRSAFYGSMAIAVMGGLIVATVLTLVFVPALYAAWYRVRPGDEAC